MRRDPRVLAGLFTSAVLALTGGVLAGPGTARAAGGVVPSRATPPRAAAPLRSIRASVPTHGGIYVPLAPARLLDTGAGTGVAAGPVAAHTSVTFPVAGRGGVPATGAGAVVINVAVASASQSGFATVYPSQTTRPGTSNLNFFAGRTVAGLVVARLGADGAVSIYNGAPASVRFVADVSGYYSAGAPTDAGAFQPIGPARVVDTGIGLGAAAASAGPHRAATATIAGRGGVPSSGVSAVVLNVTVARPARGGYATVYPYGGSRPATSSLNFAAGRTVPNLVVAQLGTGGRVSFYNGSAGSVRFVADVFGYIRSGTPTAGGTYRALRPARLVDTRRGFGNFEGAENGYVPAHGIVRIFTDSPVAGLPKYGGGALVLNVTVTDPHAGGYLTVYSPDHARPHTSNLNFVAGQTIANAVVVKPSNYGTVFIYNSSPRSVQMVVDVSGYVLAQPAIHFRDYDFVDHVGGTTTISCPTSTFCMGSVAEGTVRRFNGTTWFGPVQPFDHDNVAAVSCSSPSFCLAVSTFGDYARFDGRRWGLGTDAFQPIGGNGPTAVSCLSASFCMAVDEDGLAHRWNGSSWTTWRISATYVNTVSCTTTRFCMAVDRANHAIRYDGTAWHAIATLTTSGVSGLSCVDNGFCLAVDYNGQFRRYDGSTWSAAADTTLANPVAVSCATRTRCVVTGSSTAVAYDGSSWAPAGDLGGDQIVALDCPATSFCAGLTDDGYSRTFGSTNWGSLRAVHPSFGNANDVSCPTSSFCAVVSDHGSVVTRGAAHWGTPQVLTPRTALVSVSCPATNFCMTVGTSQAVSFGGAHWAAPRTVDPSGQLRSVSCASPTLCVAVGGSGQAYRWDGASWSGPTTIDPDAHNPSAVSCVAPASCTVVEGAGYAVSGDGATWGAPVAVGDAGLHSVSCWAASACVATDFFDGNAYVLGASGWGPPTDIIPAPGYGLSDVSCRSATFCVAVSDQLTSAFTFGGSVWTETPTSGFAFEGVSCASTAFCLGVGGEVGVVGTPV